MKRNQSELYSLRKHAQKAGKAGDTFFLRTPVSIGFMLILTAIDGITLFSLFRALLPGENLIIWALTAGFSFTLNFIPLVIAKFYHFYRYHIRGVRLWMIIAMLFVFFSLFVSTFLLRWETRESLFNDGGLDGTSAFDDVGEDGASKDEIGEDEAGNAKDNQSGETALTILLGIMPLATSAVNLALGYLTDDPVKKKLQKLKIQKAEVTAQLHVMYAAAFELSQDWYQSYDTLEQNRLAAAEAEVRQGSEYICSLARLSLAKKLGDPDSISQLTDK